MLVISSREFREKQKMYFDLVDKKEQVIVQRGKNKAYKLSLITESDRFFSDPEIIKRIEHSIRQADNGEVVRIEKNDIRKFLGV